MRLARLATALLFAVALLLLLILSATAGARSATPPRTYTVLVGAENVHRGVDVMGFFPKTVRIHVGDTVHWVQNSNEIHTVTFLGGQTASDVVVTAASLTLPEDPSPLVFNPMVVNRVAAPGGLSDTTTFVNSGLMGRENGQFRSFTVTFRARGTYHYLCLVHGVVMSGTVKVVGHRLRVAAPGKVRATARLQIARQMAKVPAVLRLAQQQIKPAVQNVDGSMTHFVELGFAKGQIDLMRFFPRQLLVRPGDKVAWEMTPFSDAPHTVTFLNGEPEPGLVIPVPQPSGPPVLYIDPATLFPSQPAPGLMRTGLYSSGLLNPLPGTTYSQGIGDVSPGPLPYLCLLHDTSGMTGTLVVLAK